MLDSRSSGILHLNEMEEEMTLSKVKICDAILSEVEGMMDTVDVARLTQGQRAEVKRLKGDLEKTCVAGDKDKAERMERCIVSIIIAGPPTHG